jgi:hypothetical protein
MVLAHSAPFDEICCTALRNEKALFTTPVLQVVKNGILQLIDFFLFAVKQQTTVSETVSQQTELSLKQERVE